jgi:hypothetical protein
MCRFAERHTWCEAKSLGTSSLSAPSLAGVARPGVAKPENNSDQISPADRDAAGVRALAAYKDFLTLWKDADPEIPILKEARAECAKLQ